MPNRDFPDVEIHLRDSKDCMMHFPGQLITTQETSTLSQETRNIISSTFGVEPGNEGE